MPYRADIDGLRALSVLAVVLYHAGLPLFGGGFVGVDVFFVISGFLITSLILHEQEAGTFSVVSFYHRRIRRILPALFAMMGGCAAVGWFLLAPSDRARLGQSIVTAALSVSNWQFWREAGYFDTPAAEKPLLHTWSLGVEEQFYLLFPLYLILVARHLPRGRLALTAALCLASLAAGAIGAVRHPIAAFYLPHARLWELLVGGLLAMNAVPVARTPAVRTGAALAGLGAILAATLLYGDDTPFPGLAALPPTLGAALVIWSGIGGASIANRALAARPLVFLGKISYSLYLWHFPLLAFGFYVGLGAMAPAQIAGLLALAFVLSLLSWRFIEQPARQAGALLAWRQVAVLTACGLVAMSWSGVALQVAGGSPGQATDRGSRPIASQPLRNPHREACYVFSSTRIEAGDLCGIGAATAAPSFVLWGDSHAETMRGALGQVATIAGHSGVFAGERACAPLIGVTRPERPECRKIEEAFLRMIVETPSIETVILAARWGWWAESLPYKREGGTPVGLALADVPQSGAASNHAALAAGLERTIAALLAAGKRVWVVGPVPEVGYDVPRYFHLRSLGLAEGLEIAPTLAEFDRRQAFVLDLLNELARRYPVGIIWPHERLCNEAGCEIARDGNVLYSDDDHLSVFGALSIASLFTPIFD